MYVCIQTTRWFDVPLSEADLVKPDLVTFLHLS